MSSRGWERNHSHNHACSAWVGRELSSRGTLTLALVCCCASFYHVGNAVTATLCLTRLDVQRWQVQTSCTLEQTCWRLCGRSRRTPGIYTTHTINALLCNRLPGTAVDGHRACVESNQAITEGAVSIAVQPNCRHHLIRSHNTSVGQIL